jgi:NACalpha-BTF3-like transcription factor
MAEPQPASLQEGASDPHAPTSTAEDRKAAAALSTLDTQDDATAKKDVDTKALDKAMKNLDVKAKKGEEKKTVKVEAGDVKLLVAELEVSKEKATEMLKGNEGSVVKAMGAYVSAEA